MRDRNTERMLWSDQKFVEELLNIQATRQLNGNKAKSLAQITKEMQECPSFEKLKKELENINLKNMLDIKLDKKRGLK